MDVKQSHTLGNAVFQVDARYVPLRAIGTGAYGMVCAAKDTLTNQEVAIKKITHAFDIVTISTRTLREIKLLKHFHGHDNIIAISTILQPPPAPAPFPDIYVVMELLETDLHRIIHSEQPLTEEHVRCVRRLTLPGGRRLTKSTQNHGCGGVGVGVGVAATSCTSCCAGSSTSTRPTCCTATSNQATCSSTARATSRSATLAWRARWPRAPRSTAGS